MRVLTQEALNRALLARQGLLERVRLSPEKAVERFGGLQTQYAPSGYVGLFSRLDGFARDDLTAALTSGRVVQAWMMRCTIHMVSRSDYAPLTAAVRLARRGYWTRLHKAYPEERFVEASELVRTRLADGPATHAELVATLTGAGLDRALFPGTQLWTDMVRVPPAGTWEKPRAHVYGLAGDLLGGPVPEPDDVVAAGEELLVRRHLRAFGPAAAPDIARWAGVTVAAVRAVLVRLDLRRFRSEDGTELVDLPRAPLPDPRVPAPVRFLSTFDAVLLLGHAARAGVVPAGCRDRVFHRSIPQSVPTVLVDGAVAGSWRVAEGRVVVTPFVELTTRQSREIDAEAERLAAFWTG